MPCTNINFENVKADGWWKHFRLNYFVQNVHGTVSESSPIPTFINAKGDGFVGNQDEELFTENMWSALMQLIFGGDDAGFKAFEKLVNSFESVYTVFRGY